MNVNTKTMVSISEANQNFSKVARLVDQYGSAVILKNNSPRYLILDSIKLMNNYQHKLMCISYIRKFNYS